MYLSELAAVTEHMLTGGDTQVRELQYNSKAVEPGDVFCCVSGTFSDGHDYAASAVKAGAVALVVERRLPLDVPQVIVPNTRTAMARMAAALYGYPARSMTMVGVTGTNGKTSTTYMLKSIAEQTGKKVGLIGTIRNLIGDEIIETERTTPESIELQRLFRRMKDAGVEIVVMEVSSHALDQKRVFGIEFDVGVFTNLTQDHLDYHKTFDNYLAAKKRLFYMSSQAVVNVDDPYADKLMEGLSVPTATFGIEKKADYSASDIEITPRGASFTMATPKGSIKMSVPTPGMFSVYNAMGAAAAAMALGFPEEAIRRGIADMDSVAGRLEPLPTGGRDFTVLLDYAHTPDALENILKTARQFAKGRIVTLFGCGGDRDPIKRPIMGEIAGKHSDFLVVTSDNPRSEDPMKIIDAVMEGVSRTDCGYTVIENRREAIKYALENARRDDVIILAGKGHETYQETADGKHHFDEKEIVAELLKQM